MDWIKTAQPENYTLYDLSTDIGQQNDIAYSHPEKVQELSKKMEDIWINIQNDAPVWPQWKAK